MAQNGLLYRAEIDVVGPTGNKGLLYRAELTVAPPNQGLLYRAELTATRHALYLWNGTAWVDVVLYSWYLGAWVDIS